MIYVLTSCLDDPRFSGFDGDVTRFRSIAPGWTTLDIKVARLADDWKPPRVRGTVGRINHYPCVNFNTPVFSAKAVSCLEDMLKPNGELLPIVADRGEYYFHNLLTVANVLDVERSEIDWLRKPLMAASIKHHEFFPDRLHDLTIFRIPQKPFSIYVSGTFVETALRGGLTGLRFAKVWPTSAGEKPEIVEAPVKLSQRSAAATEAAAKAQSVCLDVYGPPVVGDPRNIDYGQLEADLGTSLDPSGIGDFAIGHIEYADNEGVFWRFFLSCPDADKLASWLDKFLRARNIRDRVRIVARYGPYDDVEAPARELGA